MNTQTVRVTSILDRRVWSAPCADAGYRCGRIDRLHWPVVQDDGLRHRDPLQAAIRDSAILSPDVSSQRDEIVVPFERVMPTQFPPHLAEARIDIDEDAPI